MVNLFIIGRVLVIIAKVLDFLVFNLCKISEVGVLFFFFLKLQIAFFPTTTDDATFSRIIGSPNIIQHKRATFSNFHRDVPSRVLGRVIRHYSDSAEY